MNLSAEAWLVLLATGLYLYDALLLLRHDELVLVQSARGRWRPAFGANGWKIAGQEPWLPNPLAPWQALAKLRWKPEQGLAEPTTAAPGMPRIGRVPRIGVGLLMLTMFVALPLCLFVLRHTAVTLAMIAAMYACIAAVLLGLRRDALAQGLAPGAFLLLALECVACPPFCVNAVRRVSLRVAPRLTLADVAAQEAAAGRLDELKRQLRVRVDEQIEALPDGSARLAALQATARSLEQEGEA